MIRHSEFRMILVVLGLIALVGCSLMQSNRSNCPPIVPRLPPIQPNGVVVLETEHQRDLLLYFEQVERCR